MKVENNRVTFPPWLQPFLVALYIQSSTFYTGSLFRNETAITMEKKAFSKVTGVQLSQMKKDQKHDGRVHCVVQYYSITYLDSNQT